MILRLGSQLPLTWTILKPFENKKWSGKIVMSPEKSRKQWNFLKIISTKPYNSFGANIIYKS